MRTEELTALVSSLTEQIRRLEDQVASTASAATPELTHSGSGRGELCQPVRSDGSRDGGDMDSHRGNAGEKDLEVQRSNREETKAPGETSTQQVNTAANVEQEKAAERTTDAGQQSLEMPEVATRGKAVQAAAMSLNVKLGDLCQELRATYINLSKDLYHEDMTTDGLHYSQERGRKVADRLARTRQKCETNTADQSTESREQASGDNNARPGDTEPDVSIQLATNCKTGDQEERQNEATSQTEKMWPTHRPQHPAEQSFPQANPFIGLPPPPLLEPTHPQQWGPQPPVLVQRKPEVAPFPHLFSMVAHMVNCQLGHVLGRKGDRQMKRSQKRRRRRRNRKVARKGTKVAFLNMQGGRGEGKWNEVAAMMDKEEISIFGLAETHLRGKEGPPIFPGKGSQETNKEMAKCLNEDVQEMRNHGDDIILLGDFNAHIEELDGRRDGNGQYLLDLIETNDLVLGNTLSTYRKSCIHYVLMSPMISRKLVRVTIDEEGAVSVGSDHNRILAIFGGPRTTGATRNLPRERALREIETEEIARKLEKVANRDMTYESIVNCISIEIKKMKIGKGMSTRRELKSWWHPEIRQAINIRQEACRCHRAARERKVKEELWEKYRETKLKCKQVVQRRRRAVGRHTLQDLKRSGRAAPRKFWRQMKRLGRPTTIQHLKSPLTLEIVKDEEQSNNTGEGTPEDSDLLEEPSKVEMHRVLQNTQAGTALGPERVPMSPVEDGDGARTDVRELGAVHVVPDSGVPRGSTAGGGADGTRGTQGDSKRRGAGGDLGWSAFESREAVAKLAYERRLCGLGEERWARRVFKYLVYRSVNTRLTKRVARLAGKYEVPPTLLDGRPLREGVTDLKKHVQQVETRRWTESVTVVTRELQVTGRWCRARGRREGRRGYEGLGKLLLF
ncbi:hypothetical protein HPB47_020427 [Ixodes persulcatus]|uniref:Uncharacterized protein n=1 Tax=Ixodes persulcatus TaxID=34615 RepID=A0AC60QFK6_IXOPE|nr:hypothetical protein HPB47_020427 [Ixodes persulcatus]